ncbi:MAG: hypothetical protein ACUZ8H_13900 [Candidatus Anammoxibacter sp.]
MPESTNNQNLNERRIFDRPAESDHALSHGLNELEDDQEVSNRVLGKNIRMDWRVSSHREQGMLNFDGFNSIGRKRSFIYQWNSYYKSEVLFPSGKNKEGNLSAYLRQFNESNKTSSRIPPFYQLVHIGSFNKMVSNLVSSSQYGDPEEFRMKFETLIGMKLSERAHRQTMNPDDFNTRIDEIANSLNGGGKDIIKEIAGLLCSSFVKSRQPWWACFADDVVDVINNSDWAGLCGCLGMGDVNDGEWLLVWRYKRGDVGDLYRPTVVEANDSPYHFPSPPSCEYGVTMPLDVKLPNCREVAHEAPGEPLFSEACTGVLCKVEGFNIGNYNYSNIPAMRKSHGNRLVAEFPDNNDREWINRHDLTLA